MSATTTKSNPANHPNPGAARRAYLALWPEISAVSKQELVPINIDVLGAVTRAIGALPKIQALRPRLQECFAEFDFERFDKLDDMTLALIHAHSLYRAAYAANDGPAKLASRLTAVRNVLLADAQSLASHGYFRAERLGDCRRSIGYRSLASDVQVITAVLRENWKTIEKRIPATAEEIEQADFMAVELLQAVGERARAAVTAREAKVIRQKAFTLFVQTYNDARRAIAYVRGKQGDADQIAPSLYKGRNNHRPTKKSAPTIPATMPWAGDAAAALSA